MKNNKNTLVLLKEDFEILIAYIKGRFNRNSFDRQNAEELEAELKKATLVSKEDFPMDVIRLNSRVKVKQEKKDKVMEIILVTPEKADIRERKISVLAPIGTALIGFRKGQKVQWQVPKGKTTFTIMEVENRES
ncbi:MAG: nucleoside diphosphate kinase regulator [Flavisolibacter sp.]